MSNRFLNKQFATCAQSPTSQPIFRRSGWVFAHRTAFRLTPSLLHKYKELENANAIISKPQANHEKGPVLKVKPTSPQTVHLPLRATTGSVGYDLFATRGARIPPHSATRIGTGWRMRFPSGYYGQLFSRSGLAWKQDLSVEAGVIDPDYDGEIQVLLRNNHPTNVATIAAGERIAQLVLLRAVTPSVKQYHRLPRILASIRGKGGFGSTSNHPN